MEHGFEGKQAFTNVVTVMCYMQWNNCDTLLKFISQRYLYAAENIQHTVICVIVMCLNI